MTTCLCCGSEIKKFGSFKTRSDSVQRFRCLNPTCGKTFNEQRRFIGLCLDENKIVQIVPAVSEFVTSKQVSITLQGRGAGSGEGSP
jgi:hypothetical protein